MQSNEKLLTEAQAAELLDVKEGTLSVWRSTGRYAIPFIKVGRNVRYRRESLEAWLASRERAGATA
jgi:excisionase family DNA binding protein